ADQDQPGYPAWRVYVVLSSLGGDVATAMAIGRLIRVREALTMVRAGDRCASACVLIFAAGIRREAAGTLVVHRPYFATLGAGASSQQVQAHLRDLRSRHDQYAREMNLPAALVELMFSVPPDSGRVIAYQEAAALGLQGDDPVFDERLT